MHFLRRRWKTRAMHETGQKTGSGVTYGRHSKVDLTRSDVSSRSRS
jgi:hypothetical protein